MTNYQYINKSRRHPNLLAARFPLPRNEPLPSNMNIISSEHGRTNQMGIFSLQCHTGQSLLLLVSC